MEKAPTFCVLAQKLPLGITVKGMKNCIDQALDDRPVFPQEPILHNDECLISLPARDLAQRLINDVTVQCAGVRIHLKSMNEDEANEWILKTKPPKKKNPAPNSNIQKYLKQEKRKEKIRNKLALKKQKEKEEAEKLAKSFSMIDVKINQHEDDYIFIGDDEKLFEENVQFDHLNVDKYMLMDELPRFNKSDAIVWFQYLSQPDASSEYWITYSAECCWDIEGQRLEFEKQYALNPKEAVLNTSRFQIGDVEKSHKNPHSMYGDLANMKIVDKNTSIEYKLKRTMKLNGVLRDFGQIQYIRNGKIEETEIFLYDRRTGYIQDRDYEKMVKPGDNVEFYAWWNKDDDDVYIHDITQRVCYTKLHDMGYVVHAKMFAFNVRKCDPVQPSYYMPALEANGDGDEKENDGENLKKSDIMRTHQFGSRRFEGLLLYIIDGTGLIICFPFDKNPQKSIELALYSQFVCDEDWTDKLKANMCVEFCIGYNRKRVEHRYGQKHYVAVDIKIASHGFSNKFVPVSDNAVERKHKGRIIVPPKNNQHGFIYNDFENNMTRIDYTKIANEHFINYREGTFVRYNREKKPNADHEDKNVAIDVIAVEKVNDISVYMTGDNFVRYKAKRYIVGRRFKPSNDANINLEFKNIPVSKENACSSDVYLIIEDSEKYLNASLNSGGGMLFFGVDANGFIIGQQQMNRAKRDYIRNTIGQRLSQFKPAVQPSFYRVQFVEVCDIDGYVIPDCYVIMVKAAQLYAGDNINQEVVFSTSQGQIYEASGRVRQVQKASEAKQLQMAQMQQQQRKVMVSPSIQPQNMRSKPLISPNQIKQPRFPLPNEEVMPYSPAPSVHSSAHHSYVGSVSVSNEEKLQTPQQTPGSSHQTYGNTATPTPSSSYLSYGRDNHQPFNQKQRIFPHMYPISTPTPNGSAASSVKAAVKPQQPQIKPVLIPPDNAQGKIKLMEMVQKRFNELVETNCAMDARWLGMFDLMENESYMSQKNAWILMEKIHADTQQNVQQQNDNNHNVNHMNDVRQMGQMDSYSSISQKSVNPPPTEILIKEDPNSEKAHFAEPSIGQKYAANLVGAEPEIDVHGLPTLCDKSKYKAVAMEYCQRMGWKKPTETAQCIGAGYRATVTFGKPGAQKRASGDGLKQKSAIYEAYIKLLPVVIPRNACIELMIKWVPGYKKQEKVQTATIAESGQSIRKHPKSVLLEWAQKNSITPPKTTFSEYSDSSRNMRIWTAKVTFCGKTATAKATKKKDAEMKCFDELMSYIMNGRIQKSGHQ